MKKKIVTVILISICSVMFVSSIFFFAKIGKSDSSINKKESIITVSEESGTLTSSQLKAINNGANIDYNGNIYRLYKSNEEEKVYSFTDDDFTQRKITIKPNGGYYVCAPVGSDFINNALLTSALSEYLKTVDFNTLLKNYATKTSLTDYVNKNALGDVVEYYTRATTLTLKPYYMYLVQCYDSSYNLADMKIVGGNADGKAARFALCVSGNGPAQSLVFYQTGSIVLSELVKSGTQITGIVPKNSDTWLYYYKIGGKIVKNQ